MAQAEQLALRREPGSPPYLALRQSLVDARLARGLTQAQLAVSLGRPQSFVAKYEVGERFVDAVEFIAIASVLDVDVETIAERIRSSLGW